MKNLLVAVLLVACFASFTLALFPFPNYPLYSIAQYDPAPVTSIVLQKELFTQQYGVRFHILCEKSPDVFDGKVCEIKFNITSQNGYIDDPSSTDIPYWYVHDIVTIVDREVTDLYNATLAKTPITSISQISGKLSRKGKFEKTLYLPLYSSREHVLYLGFDNPSDSYNITVTTSTYNPRVTPVTPKATISKVTNNSIVSSVGIVSVIIALMAFLF